MAVQKVKHSVEDEERVQMLGAAADRIGDLLEEYEISTDDIDEALRVGARRTLTEMYPELAVLVRADGARKSSTQAI